MWDKVCSDQSDVYIQKVNIMAQDTEHPDDFIKIIMLLQSDI